MNLFARGVKIQSFKDLSLSSIRIKPAPPPNHAVIFLCQHEGLPALAIVKKGENVLVGTLIAARQGELSSHVHSSVSGKVTEVTEHYIVIHSDGRDERDPSITEHKHPERLSAEEIIERIGAAGVVGLGGGGFPTDTKLKFAGQFPPEQIVINCCESDAYLTSDYVLMLQHAAEVLRGAEFVQKAVNVSRVCFVLQKNQIEAVEIMLSKIRSLKFSDFHVRVLPERYPQGAESQVARMLYPNEQIAPRMLLLNVATVYAVYEAVRFAKPLYERVVTVSGQVLVEPQNLLVRIGTSAKALIQQCKGFLREPSRVLYGGPMSGASLYHLETPVTKQVNGLIALPPELSRAGRETECTRCGLCADACPEELLPETLMRAMEHCHEELIQQLRLSACIECGNCSYVCPSNIPVLARLIKGKKQFLLQNKKEPSFLYLKAAD